MAILYMAGRVTRHPVILRDADELGAWLKELAAEIDMHEVSLHLEPYAHWPNGAPSAVLFIEESSITAHTYPEEDFIELILHSCKVIPGVQRVAMTIQEKLGLRVAAYHHLGNANWRELAKEVRT
tara:strand:+ start:1270 stop:1644 length:375 start_codon:yes stop_codon:yes gene_type:complete